MEKCADKTRLDKGEEKNRTNQNKIKIKENGAIKENGERKGEGTKEKKQE